MRKKGGPNGSNGHEPEFHQHMDLSREDPTASGRGLTEPQEVEDDIVNNVVAFMFDGMTRTLVPRRQGNEK